MLAGLKRRYGRLKIRLREAHGHFQHSVKAFQVFENWHTYLQLFGRKDSGETVLRTRSGLRIAVRHNLYDVLIVREQYIDRFYLRHFASVDEKPLEDHKPTIVDVGSYIGDFVLYCAHQLGARVIAYEPIAENFEMLERNITLNPAIAEQITTVHKGIANADQVVSNVQVMGREIHASSYYYADDPIAEKRTIPCDTLADVLTLNKLERIDLLKVDCEGGEYDIFSEMAQDVYDRIGTLVFEWHKVPDWQTKFKRVIERLESAGFTLEHRGQLVYGFRA
ncbi:MAG: FkbM family methyltransferase [Cyanobacteria bacterium P01_A01_bin.114]